MKKLLTVLLFFSLPSFAQNAVRNSDVLAALQQGGVFLQLENSGTTLAIRTAGVVALNCTGNLACSYDSPSDTFTMNNDPGVTVLNFPSTQPVSGSVSVTGPVNIGNSPFHPIPVTVSTPIIVIAYVNGVHTPVQLVEGQSVMSQSIPVAISSDQTTVPVVDTTIANIVNTVRGIPVISRTIGLPLQPCNAVRTTNCQHF